MEAIKKRLTEILQEKYDKEYAETAHLISDAYALGLEDGALKAKAEIINLISGGKHENKTDI
jgi:hypothetical protein